MTRLNSGLMPPLAKPLLKTDEGMTLALDDIRAEIDALDADLRRLILARADLVSQIAAAKAADGNTASPLRPLREMQQMQALLAWQKNHAPALNGAGLIAIWREIIGMALAQQGGLTVYASPAAMSVARAHFGASLTYLSSDTAMADAAADARGLAVVSLAEASAPQAGQAVLARLPVLGAAAALLYGAPQDDVAPDSVSLVVRSTPQQGDTVLGIAGDCQLVETRDPHNDDVWGRYLTLEAGA